MQFLAILSAIATIFGVGFAVVTAREAEHLPAEPVKEEKPKKPAVSKKKAVQQVKKTVKKSVALKAKARGVENGDIVDDIVDFVAKAAIDAAVESAVINPFGPTPKKKTQSKKKDDDDDDQSGVGVPTGDMGGFSIGDTFGDEDLPPVKSPGGARAAKELP